MPHPPFLRFCISASPPFLLSPHVGIIFPGFENCTNPGVILVSESKERSESAEGLAPKTDAELVERAVSGDLGAFDRLVERYQGVAYRLAWRMVSRHEDARDVVQEAFLRAWQGLGDLANPGGFSAWLLKIVSRQALNLRRSRRQFSPVSLDRRDESHPGSLTEQLPDTAAPPGENAGAAELRQRLEQEVHQLPEPERLALMLSSVEGMPQTRVAELLDCSVEAVKWRVFQARKKLKYRLRNYL